MITVSTTSPEEARAAEKLFRQASWLNWRVYQTDALVASSALSEQLPHPAHERMRELLIQRGQEGYLSSKLWDKLCDEGLDVARETVHRWLSTDERLGYIIRTGKPRSRWVWAGDAR